MASLALVADFDGTLVRPDTIRLLAELGMGALRARQLARDVDRGRVPVQDAIERMVASVTTTEAIALGFLSARARPDPGAAALLGWARQAGVPVTIASAGLEPVVRYFLGPLVEGVDLVANGLAVEPAPGGGCAWRVVSREAGAPEAVKRRVVERHLEAGRAVAYVGDGVGDFEAASLAAVAGRSRGPALGSLAFARDALAERLAAAGLPFIPFATLDDVRSALARAPFKR
jgi:HAD superfamily phosphoserine phosphatase-like hydrolase